MEGVFWYTSFGTLFLQGQEGTAEGGFILRHPRHRPPTIDWK